jgi:phosphatidylinositol glycan class T
VAVSTLHVSIDFSNFINVLTNLNSVTASRPALIPMLIARLRGQKADPSNSESSPVSPAGLKLLLKVAFVAVVAVAFHYLSNS